METLKDLNKTTLNIGDDVVYADLHSNNANPYTSKTWESWASRKGLGLTFGTISHVTGGGRLAITSWGRSYIQYRYPEQVLKYEKTNTRN
jgi:hypothetical protein